MSQLIEMHWEKTVPELAIQTSLEHTTFLPILNYRLSMQKTASNNLPHDCWKYMSTIRGIAIPLGALWAQRRRFSITYHYAGWDMGEVIRSKNETRIGWMVSLRVHADHIFAGPPPPWQLRWFSRTPVKVSGDNFILLTKKKPVWISEFVPCSHTFCHMSPLCVARLSICGFFRTKPTTTVEEKNGDTLCWTHP